MTLQISLLAALTLLSIQPTMAAQQVCKSDTLPATVSAQSIEAVDGQLPVELLGEEVESVGDELVKLKGDAEVKRGKQSMAADEIIYYRQSDEVEGKGNVVVRTQRGDQFNSKYTRFHIDTQVGFANEVEFELADEGKVLNDRIKVAARGRAEKINFEGEDVARLENVSYSTCAKGQDDVFVSADEMTLDQAIGRGTAKNATIRFKGVPIFYAPYLSFPTNDQRKSGFLSPSFGADSDSGFVLQTPYYFNLAPNYDATFFPRYYSERGLQIAGQVRYLLPTGQGHLYGEALPSDKLFNDEDRNAFAYRHQQEITERWDADINLQHVSDTRYYRDFSNDIQRWSASYLPQTARTNYRTDHWNFSAGFLSYQVIDETVSSSSEPYDRLPRLQARSNYPVHSSGIRYGLETELVQFKNDERVDGLRWDATPFVEYPVNNIWGFATPRISLRHTSYNLDDQAVGLSDSPSRSLPVFSVDSGLFFERKASWNQRSFIQTLEPRLFYVYIPEENQDDIPLFDTSSLNFNNFGSIYREHRFFGRDRVGDTNQVTIGLISRMLSADTGQEWIRASIGQAYFLDDREVNLTSDTVDTTDKSDLLAEISAKLTDNWTTSAFLQWSESASELGQARADINYRESNKKRFGISYRYNNNNLQQLGINARWPLSPRWQLIFDDQYSIEQSENLRALLGLEYDGCCWKTRTYVQRRIDGDNNFKNSIVFELELNGLGSIRTGLK